MQSTAEKPKKNVCDKCEYCRTGDSTHLPTWCCICGEVPKPERNDLGCILWEQWLDFVE